MSIIAKLNYLHIAPRKVRLVADLVRGKRVSEAQRILTFTTRKAAKPILKLLKSAIANAKNNFQLEEDNLYISKILVNEGPKLKRWRARARGRAYEIQKKTSHVIIDLEEVVKKTKKVKKVKKTPKEKEEGFIATEETQKEEKKPESKRKFEQEFRAKKPKTEKGIRRIFRRKSF